MNSADRSPFHNRRAEQEELDQVESKQFSWMRRAVARAQRYQSTDVPRVWFECLLKTYNRRVNVRGEQRRLREFLLPRGFWGVLAESENHDRSFSGQ